MTVSGGGRLPDAIDAAMERLNTSVDIDWELWREDIAGSIAHAEGLARAGVLTNAEALSIVTGLQQIKAEIERGEFFWDRKKEDVHMNIEARLRDVVGPVGGKLHTGRSRNDQVATDLRLWTRRRCEEAILAVDQLASAVLDRASSEIVLLMPAYTHLQRAQPSRLSHHLLAWQEMLFRDRGRLVDAMERLNESPLGAGAVAGTGFPLDREGVARALGFRQPMQNSIDATGSRDFLMEVASALAIFGVHLSRIGEEIVLWSTQEFGFMTLSDAFSTSSSMMPQKKNPDVAELVRGKCARLDRLRDDAARSGKEPRVRLRPDLQEDKRPIFDAFECALTSARALTGAIATATFHGQRMKAALATGHLCATDLADFLVQRGLPFREAHHVVGAIVRQAEERGVQIGELPADVLVAAHPALTGPELTLALESRGSGGTPFTRRWSSQGPRPKRDRRGARALAHARLSARS
ncbi:MAG: argininosuccinate lyase [Pseudomonadota bacterium]